MRHCHSQGQLSPDRGLSLTFNGFAGNVHANLCDAGRTDMMFRFWAAMAVVGVLAGCGGQTAQPVESAAAAQGGATVQQKELTEQELQTLEPLFRIVMGCSENGFSGQPDAKMGYFLCIVSGLDYQLLEP